MELPIGWISCRPDSRLGAGDSTKVGPCPTATDLHWFELVIAQCLPHLAGMWTDVNDDNGVGNESITASIDTKHPPYSADTSAMVRTIRTLSPSGPSAHTNPTPAFSGGERVRFGEVLVGQGGERSHAAQNVFLGHAAVTQHMGYPCQDQVAKRIAFAFP